ncbi:hypothetical protein DLAC_06795 [Tieghemostelium lacteum]|uniref:Uncharacterized protein n=1 Tax=Tieghemostelium lacteum TaxID=361077 RepID=A0A151ZDH1_TIELA|nr:hypothetical protein DLAC_06795 [Tieghemostelium lacteum]|eukprot:KYQ91975.1 hypothetical protein DLAC_06795 [Tieghemostelium lacteum]
MKLMIQCSKFQENRWKPNQCSNCFLYHKSTTTTINSINNQEIADNLKSDYLLLPSKSAELNNSIDSVETVTRPLLRKSIEIHKKPIEKTLPLLLYKETKITPKKMQIVQFNENQQQQQEQCKNIQKPTRVLLSSDSQSQLLHNNMNSSSSSSTITTNNTHMCKEFAQNQWRPNICTYCFLPKSKHTTTTTTTTTTTMSSPLQSTTISTTTTITTTSSHKSPNNIAPLLRHKSKSLPPKLLPKLSQASLELYSTTFQLCKFTIIPPIILSSDYLKKPILIEKHQQLQPTDNISTTTTTTTTPTITTITTTQPIETQQQNNISNNKIEDKSKNRYSITFSTSKQEQPELLLDDELPKSRRNSGTIQPLRLKSFSFCNSHSNSLNSFDDDPFRDFEDLVDDDDNDENNVNGDIDSTKNETSLTITTPSQTTMLTSTTTILQSPRLIETTTTTTSSIIPSSLKEPTVTASSTSSTTSTTTKRKSLKMDQYKEKEDEWDQGVDLSTFLSVQRKKNSRSNTPRSKLGAMSSLMEDFSYCSNKFMEISSVKEEAQRQSIDFGGGIHPNAFEAFIGILEAKQKQIEKAFQRQKIDKSDCDMLSVELNSVKDLLNNLMENFNRNPPVIPLQNAKEVKQDIKSHSTQRLSANLSTSICVSAISQPSNDFIETQ